MINEIKINGYCEERFQSVKEAFSKNFEEGLEVGSSFAVSLDGKLVIDLWGGYADAECKKPWKENTIVNVFSTTKVMTALCIHILVDRGLIDIDAPVAKYWPEFAQAGKENILVRNVLSHSAGLPGFDEKITMDVLYDWDRIINILEAQKPWWKPGTRIGYHSITFGYLLGELVRRVSGKTLGTFFRDEIAIPLNIDFHVGLSKENDPRVAEMIAPERFLSKLQLLLFKLFCRKGMKVMFNPNIEIKNVNERAWRGAEIPSSNGHGNARSIAQVGAILACGGEVDNNRLLSLSAIEKALKEEINGRDMIVFYKKQSFGLGFGLLNDRILLGPHGFYWSGFGGSLCVMDIEKKVSMGYAMNNLIVLNDPRAERLIQAVWNVID